MLERPEDAPRARSRRLCLCNISLAAQRAGKERRSFGKLLKKHGIDKRGYRAETVEH